MNEPDSIQTLVRVPAPCSRVQQEIEILQWIQTSERQLDRLPQCKLKDAIKTSLDLMSKRYDDVPLQDIVADLLGLPKDALHLYDITYLKEVILKLYEIHLTNFKWCRESHRVAISGEIMPFIRLIEQDMAKAGDDKVSSPTQSSA